jgi:hypothetical protein
MASDLTVRFEKGARGCRVEALELTWRTLPLPDRERGRARGKERVRAR